MENMDKIKEQVSKLGESKTLVRVLYVIGGIIVIKVIFFAGIMVGFHKASYGRNWGENYEKNFGMGRRDFRMGALGGDKMMGNFPNSHGATGKILKIEGQDIFLQDKDGTEKILSVGVDTKIQKENTEIKLTDLKIDDFLITIGTPNTQGIVEAKLIRVIPSPESLNTRVPSTIENK